MRTGPSWNSPRRGRSSRTSAPTPDLARVDASAADARVGPALHGLTRRELQVLRLVSAGKTNAAIAAELFAERADGRAAPQQHLHEARSVDADRRHCLGLRARTRLSADICMGGITHAARQCKLGGSSEARQRAAGVRLVGQPMTQPARSKSMSEQQQGAGAARHRGNLQSGRPRCGRRGGGERPRHPHRVRGDPRPRRGQALRRRAADWVSRSPPDHRGPDRRRRHGGDPLDRPRNAHGRVSGHPGDRQGSPGGGNRHRPHHRRQDRGMLGARG